MARDPAASHTTPERQTIGINDRVILNKCISKVKMMPTAYETVVTELYIYDHVSGEIAGIAVRAPDGSSFMIAKSEVNKTTVDGTVVRRVAFPLTTSLSISLNRLQAKTYAVPRELMIWLEKNITVRRLYVGMTRTRTAAQMTLLDPELDVA
jgi:hypothetical protein